MKESLETAKREALKPTDSLFFHPCINAPRHPRLTYRQQIRDPRWIQFATKLKTDAGWCCEHCQSRQGLVELTVHHTFYVPDLLMWEHPRCLLIVLCCTCHAVRQELEQPIYVNIADLMRDKSNAELLEQPISAFFADGFTLSNPTDGRAAA